MRLAQLMTITYTPEQQTIIDEAVTEAQSSRGIEYAWSDRLVERQDQVFAVFGSTARELLRFDSLDVEDNGAAHFDYLPVVIDGRMMEECPDEGRSGMLYLMRCTKRRGQPRAGSWMTCYIGTGWLHTSELELTNQQITEHLVTEIEAGENVITNKPAGWA